MSRPPAAREAVLDAFERLIIADGERGATIDATARAAGVSKGGLLYHFGTRDALIGGLLTRLHRLIDDDVALIDAAPEGAVAYFVRSSVELETPLDRTFIATVRLAQGGDHAAARAIDDVRARWLEVLGRHVGDPTLALAVTLIGDGLYYHAALRAEAESPIDAADGDGPGETSDPLGPAEMDGLIAMLEGLAGGSGGSRTSSSRGAENP